MRSPLVKVVVVAVFGVGAGSAFASPTFAAGVGYVPPPVISSNSPPLPPSATGGPVVPPSLPVTAPSLFYTAPHSPHHRTVKKAYRLVLDSPSGTPGASLTAERQGLHPRGACRLHRGPPERGACNRGSGRQLHSTNRRAQCRRRASTRSLPAVDPHWGLCSTSHCSPTPTPAAWRSCSSSSSSWLDSSCSS